MKIKQKKLSKRFFVWFFLNIYVLIRLPVIPYWKSSSFFLKSFFFKSNFFCCSPYFLYYMQSRTMENFRYYSGIWVCLCMYTLNTQTQIQFQLKIVLWFCHSFKKLQYYTHKHTYISTSFMYKFMCILFERRSQ